MGVGPAKAFAHTGGRGEDMSSKNRGKPSTDATECLNCGKLQGEMDILATKAAADHDAMELDLVRHMQANEDTLKLIDWLIVQLDSVAQAPAPMDNPLAMAMAERALRSFVDAKQRREMIVPGGKQRGKRNAVMPKVR